MSNSKTIEISILSGVSVLVKIAPNDTVKSAIKKSVPLLDAQLSPADRASGRHLVLEAPVKFLKLVDFEDNGSDDDESTKPGSNGSNCGEDINSNIKNEIINNADEFESAEEFEKHDKNRGKAIEAGIPHEKNLFQYLHEKEKLQKVAPEIQSLDQNNDDSKLRTLISSSFLLLFKPIRIEGIFKSPCGRYDYNQALLATKNPHLHDLVSGLQPKEWELQTSHNYNHWVFADERPTPNLRQRVPAAYFPVVDKEEARNYHKFPEFKSRNVNMMPFVIGDKLSLPKYLWDYWPMILKCMAQETKSLHTLSGWRLNNQIGQTINGTNHKSDDSEFEVAGGFNWHFIPPVNPYSTGFKFPNSYMYRRTEEKDTIAKNAFQMSYRDFWNSMRKNDNHSSLKSTNSLILSEEPGLAACFNSEIGKIGYLTVHESVVGEADPHANFESETDNCFEENVEVVGKKTQRRPGLHCESPGLILGGKGAIVREKCKDGSMEAKLVEMDDLGNKILNGKVSTGTGKNTSPHDATSSNSAIDKRTGVTKPASGYLKSIWKTAKEFVQNGSTWQARRNAFLKSRESRQKDIARSLFLVESRKLVEKRFIENDPLYDKSTGWNDYYRDCAISNFEAAWKFFHGGSSEFDKNDIRTFLDDENGTNDDEMSTNDNSTLESSGAGNESHQSLRAYCAWGGGSLKQTLKGGIFMGSTVSDSCEVFPVIVKDPAENLGNLGSCEHLREICGKGHKLKAGEIVWMTDTTPHESLPIEAGTKRQFFRFVTSEVSVWHENHSTKNPLGVVPDKEVTVVVKGNKFEKK